MYVHVTQIYSVNDEKKMTTKTECKSVSAATLT